MARSGSKQRFNRSFIVLAVIVIAGGAFLWSQGDLISPFQSTGMVVSMASGTTGFAMVGDGQRPAADTSESSSSAPASAEPAAQTEVLQTAAGTMTMEAFLVELSAAGVDVDAVSATMSAEGRSMDNLLAVVNSGRTTVTDLAARLNGAAPSEAEGQSPQGESAGLWNLRWDELGSVAYDLWLILAVTAAIIVIGRPVGWLISQFRRTPSVSSSVSS